jgi:hypothetical protein
MEENLTRIATIGYGHPREAVLVLLPQVTLTDCGYPV